MRLNDIEFGSIVDSELIPILRKYELTTDHLLAFLIRRRIDVGMWSKVWFRGDVLHEIVFNGGKLVSWQAEEGLKPEKVRESLELSR